MVASSNADIQMLDAPDLRRWIAVKMDVTVTAVDMDCDKAELREKMLTYFKRLSKFPVWIDSVMYKAVPSIQFYTDQIIDLNNLQL